MADPITRMGGYPPFTTNQKLEASLLNRIGKMLLQTVYGVQSRLQREDMGSNPNNGFVGNDCEPSVTGDLEVTIQPGVAFIYTAAADAYSPDYRLIAVDAAEALEIPAHHATLPRKDRIVLAPKYEDELAENHDVKNPTTGTVTSTSMYTRRRVAYELTVVEGTANASPVAPAAPSGTISICTVDVPATSGAVTITDVRTRMRWAIDRVYDLDVSGDLDVAGTASVATLDAAEVVDDIVYDENRYSQTAVDMLSLVGAFEAGRILETGGWDTFIGAWDANLAGELVHSPYIGLDTPANTNKINIPIDAHVRPGCFLYQVIVIAEADTGTVTMECALEKLAWAGSSSSMTVEGSDSQDIGDVSRNVVTFTPDSGAAVHGAIGTGQEFYSLRLEVTGTTGSPTKLGIYGIILVWMSPRARRLLGDAES